MATETKLDLARAFHALGDPNRLAIYQLIRQSDEDDAGQSAEELRNSVSTIAARFDISLSTVSHHLKELRTAGLIRCERRGQHIFCSANSDVLAEIEQFVKSES